MNEVKKVKPRITIGTIGHIDHGKTSLTAAIIKLFDDAEKAERMEPKTHRGIELKSNK